jgi:single-stranded DNA-binding protein
MLNVTSKKTRIFRPKVKFLPSGTAVCDFALGNSSKNKDGTWRNFFHEAKAFGKIAEAIGDMDKKDIEIVSASLTQDEWKDKTSGALRKKDVVIVWEFKEIEAAAPAATVQDDDIPF